MRFFSVGNSDLKSAEQCWFIPNHSYCQTSIKFKMWFISALVAEKNFSRTNKSTVVYNGLIYKLAFINFFIRGERKSLNHIDYFQDIKHQAKCLIGCDGHLRLSFTYNLWKTYGSFKRTNNLTLSEKNLDFFGIVSDAWNYYYDRKHLTTIILGRNYFIKILNSKISF